MRTYKNIDKQVNKRQCLYNHFLENSIDFNSFPAYLSCVILEPNFRVYITLELTIFFFGIFANDNDFDKIPQGIFQLQNFPFYTTWFTYLTASCQKR